MISPLVPIRNEKSVLNENREDEEDDALDEERKKILSDDIELEWRQRRVTFD